MVQWHGCLIRDIGRLRMPSEIRFAELLRFVRRHGWQLIRIRGSHHIFEKPDGSMFAIPVHRGKVKPFYWREVKKQVGED